VEAQNSTEANSTMAAYNTTVDLPASMDPRNTVLEDRNFALEKMDGAKFSWYHVRYVSIK